MCQKDEMTALLKIHFETIVRGISMGDKTLVVLCYVVLCILSSATEYVLN